MRIFVNMAVKNWLPWKVDGHAIQVSKYFQKCLGNVAKFGGDSFNRLEVIPLQSWRGPQKPPRSELGHATICRKIFLCLTI